MAGGSAGDLKTLFAESVVLVPGSSPWLQIKLSQCGFGDVQMTLLGRFLDDLLPEPVDGEAICANIDLNDNAIGNAGLTAVLDALERKCVSCKIIKLFKNRISDEGGVRLAQAVRRQTSAVEEIHLSHNLFSARTLVALCMALAKHDGYPIVGRNRLYIPCWVRMEYNNIARPLEVLEMLRRHGPVTVCTAENRDQCGPWRCACANRTMTSVPKIHLFAIHCQIRARVAEHSDADMRQEIRKWGGDLKPVAPSASGRPAVKAMLAPTGPRPARPKPGAAVPPALARESSGPGVWENTARRATPQVALVPAADAPDSHPAGKALDSPLADIGTANVEAGLEQSVLVKAEAPPEAQKLSEENGNTIVGNAVAGTSGNTVHDVRSRRPSLVLDSAGRRRILSKQLEDAGEGQSAQFVCPLCEYVNHRPVMTACSHMFCHPCFGDYVAGQVSKTKKNGSSDSRVPTIPCPVPQCKKQLRQGDVRQLDKAGPEGATIRRVRNNLRVRCVHHPELFKFPCGKDAEVVKSKTGLACTWIGDLSAFEEHIAKSCAVEKQVVRCEEAAISESADAAPATLGISTSGVLEDPLKADGEQHNSSSAVVSARTCEVGDGGADVSAASAPVAASEPKGDETRIVRYDYIPKESDGAQIALRTQDLVKIFEVTKEGWAAGVKLCRTTHQEVGEPGWFPVGYLFPAEAA